MLTPEKSTQFKRDQRKAEKQGKDFAKLRDVIKLLLEEKPLPQKCVDHLLSGNWKGYRDCHIENDWVLIYKIDKSQKVLLLQRLGSHAELFG
ncbi:MAG: type II toxin-antitoxin system YafQ family toxin [Verrucomicrobia bacterium]|nr:type II toxin-antitoxin system YafQ family toxin [Verrucomicrobiota bacterium]